MKYLSLYIITLFLSSCCSAKRATQDNSKEIAQNTSKKSTLTTKIDETKNNTTVLKKQSTTPILTEKSQSQVIAHHEVTPEILEVFNHDTFNSLLQNYISPEGNVNYKGIKEERTVLINYIESLGKNMPNYEWTNEERLAYWINAYNAMTIDLILRNYPVKSIKDIKDPWKQRLWKLADKWYNLDEIEHQIIRKMNEPRIHFALVCAAVSCPKLYNKAFTASTLEYDLTKLTREFLADTSKNMISENSLKLSKIFSWFSKDFKQDGSLIDFLNKYTDVQVSSNAKKRFNDYNWNLND